jgi:hypothetical protein
MIEARRPESGRAPAHGGARATARDTVPIGVRCAAHWQIEDDRALVDRIVRAPHRSTPRDRYPPIRPLTHSSIRSFSSPIIHLDPEHLHRGNGKPASSRRRVTDSVTSNRAHGRRVLELAPPARPRPVPRAAREAGGAGVEPELPTRAHGLHAQTQRPIRAPMHHATAHGRAV